MSKIKITDNTRAGQGAEHLELSYIAGRNGADTVENTWAFHYKVKHRLTI